MQISEAFERIGHVLNNPDGAVLLGNLRVLNDAGAHLYSMRQWRFARHSSVNVSLIATQEFLTLPLGCAKVVDLRASASWGGVVKRATPAELAAIKATELTGPIVYWSDVFVSGGDAALLRRLEIYPPQDTTVTDALVLSYYTEWQKVTNAIDTNVGLPFPEYCEPLFGRLLECFALGMARPESGTVDEHLSRLGPVYVAAAEADSRSVLDYGPARHTALQSASGARDRSIEWDAGTVSLPSV